MAQFGLSPNQLKLPSASMAKSDNNRTLVCGAEMLRQGWLDEGACVHVFLCPAEFSACCPLICQEAGDKQRRSEQKRLGYLCVYLRMHVCDRKRLR